MWKDYYSKNVNVKDISNGGFELVLKASSEPHYVLRSGTKKFANGKTIEWAMSVDLDPNGAKIYPTQGSSPAAGTVMMSRSGDDLSGVGKYASYRLWCGAARIQLLEGAFEAHCPMQPSSWTNVNGQVPKAAEWNGMLENLDKIGVTFGGTFFGHGVHVSGGKARIRVTRFEPV